MFADGIGKKTNVFSFSLFRWLNRNLRRSSNTIKAGLAQGQEFGFTNQNYLDCTVYRVSHDKFGFTNQNYLDCTVYRVSHDKFQGLKNYDLKTRTLNMICTRRRVSNNSIGRTKVVMQGKLIAVSYTLRTYLNQFSLGGICKQEQMHYCSFSIRDGLEQLILIINIIVSYDQNISVIFYVKD